MYMIWESGEGGSLELSLELLDVMDVVNDVFDLLEDRESFS